MKKAVLIPLRELVIFPDIIMPLYIGRDFSIKALTEIMKKDMREFAVCLQKSDDENISEDDFYNTGVIVNLIQSVKLPDNSYKVLVEGKSRINIRKVKKNSIGFFECEYNDIRAGRDSEKVRVIMNYTRNLFSEYTRFEKKIPQELVKAIMSNQDPEKLCNLIGAHIIIHPFAKQEILDEKNLYTRYEKEAFFLESELELLKMENKIEKDVRKRLNRQQKEYYLREQMKIIQEELGNSEKTEIENIKNRLSENIYPDYVVEKIGEELKTLERAGSFSHEYGATLNYVDWVLSLPWNNMSDEQKDITICEKILEQSHYGMEKVKQRIIEFIAVRKLCEKPRTTILCLAGPPGVGKTSLGKAVAKSLDRKFLHYSLGGVHDESQIRGHRMAYIGSRPGNIISQLKDCGVRNPVFMLDEVDKLGVSYQGDPASALLEVLDPEQNNEFKDNYINLPFDLSEVFFITTANYIYDIPQPLLDRMEIIELPGYTVKEKIELATQFLIPRLMKEHGLKKEDIRLGNNVIKDMIENYTMEAGVRKLSQMISQLMRKAALHILKNTGNKKSFNVRSSDLTELIGPPVFKDSFSNRKNEKGIANGLAWTSTGGDVLLIEVVLTEGEGRLTLTGSLGEVMKESGQAALTYIKSAYRKFGIKKDIFRKYDIHIHVPEGAVPKDGPSAGITMMTAMVSALSGRKFNRNVAMTGEITLRGTVLPIGGLKEKSLAAYMRGIKKIIIPHGNFKDLIEIPEEVRTKIEFLPVKHAEEVIKEALL